MIFPFFGQKSNKILGIDIGTYSIKIVALEKDKNNNIILNNYGMLKSERLFQDIPKEQKQFHHITTNSVYYSKKAKFSIETTVEALNNLLKATKIDYKNVVFAIPDFHTFTNSFTLPMFEDKKELAQAVAFEIQKYVPIPYSELEIDWSWSPISNSLNITKEQKKSEKQASLIQNKKNKQLIKILFTAIPKEVILQYKEIGKKMHFKSVEMEPEIFSLVRALKLETKLKNLIVLIEIGVQSTTISIIEKEKIKISYSFNISGFEIDRLLVSSLKIDLKKAEEFKEQYGIIGIPPSKEKSNKNIILPLVNLILEKYKQITDVFLKNREDNIEKIYLSGGTASLPGLAEYFSYILKIPTDILNPLKYLIKDKITKPFPEQVGTSYTIALGAALKKIKKF